MTAYRLNLTPDDGSYLITAPSLPELTSFADDVDGARAYGLNALLEAIAARIRRNEAVPIDTVLNEHRGPVVFVELPLLVDLKLDLYRALRKAGINRAELARRMKVARTSVDRLFDLDHLSRLDQIEQALKALGLGVTMDVVPLNELPHLPGVIRG